METFVMPSIEPASPPLTPASSQASPLLRRRPFFEHLRSPPPHIRPSSTPHQFSYTPPRHEGDDEVSSSENDDDWLALRAKIFRRTQRSKISQDSSHPKSTQSHLSRVVEILSEAESEAHNVARDRKGDDTIRILVTEEIDFTLEELRDDDLGFLRGIEVLRPYLIEDALSDRGPDDALEVSSNNQDLPPELRQFRCELNSRESRFEHMHKLRKMGRRKRWSRGGSHKRSHTESVGSDSGDNDDVEPLDTSSVGSLSRRLRRRTRGPEDMIRPRTSLLFDDVPKELEELKWIEENMPPDLAEDVAEFTDWAKVWMDEVRYEISEFDDDGGEYVESSMDDSTFPQWLYKMEVESNPSRPTTSRGAIVTRP